MTDSHDLSGRVALICGAGGGGIGTATSRLLAEAGADIFAVDHSQELLDETIGLVEGLGRKCWGKVADLRDPAQTGAVVARAKDEAGRVDFVANIAGGMQPKQWGPIQGTPDDIYQSVMALNLDYVFAICRDAAKLMIEQGRGGSIVNISSVSALPSAPFHAPYGAAKAAVVAFTRSLAVELGRYAIRANVVAPGATKTERAKRMSGGAIDARQKEWAPLGRPTASEDVAEAIRFFLSDAAAGITGQLLTVDCGLTARCALGSLDYFEARASW